MYRDGGMRWRTQINDGISVMAGKGRDGEHDGDGEEYDGDVMDKNKTKTLIC